MSRVRSGRHSARRLALQTLFEIDFRPPSGMQGRPEDEVRVSEGREPFQDAHAIWERGAHRAGLSESAGTFAWELIVGVLQRRAELDAVIARLAPEWPVEQLAPIDRNVLRVALFELRHHPDTPAAAVIDEAVELAKDFGSEASPRFVNGVLASVVREGTAR